MIPLSIIDQYAHSSPQRLAVIVGDESMSWHEFAERVRLVADAFAERLDNAADNRAVLLGERSIEYVLAASALASLGVPWIGLDSQANPDQLAQQLTTSAPTLIVTKTPAPITDMALAGLPEPIAFASLAAFDGQDGSHLASWQKPTFLALSFTSGTTGAPKLAVRRNPSEVRRTETFVERYGFGPGDTHLVTVPFSHASGHGWARLFLAVGATIVLAGDADPSTYAATIEQHQVRTSLMVPPVLRSFVVAAEQTPEIDLSSLRFLLTGGRQLPPRVFRKAAARLGPVITTYYGTTETGVNLVADSDTLAAAPLSSGLPLTGNEVLVLGRDRRPVRRGQNGRVALASYMAMAGYANLEPDTVVYHGLTFFLTADYGYLDAHNRLVLTNRDDGLPEGAIFPAIQIEADLHEVLEISDAVVIRVPDRNGVPEVHAAIVLIPDADAELARKQAGYVVEHWLPEGTSHTISVLTEIPYGRTGKVDVVALRSVVCTGEPAADSSTVNNSTAVNPTGVTAVTSGARSVRKPCLCCSITTS